MMKSKFSILLLVFIFFTCQKVSEDEQLNWMEQIDKEVSEFEQTKSIFKKGSFVDHGDETSISLFKSKNSSVIKYTSEGYLGDLYPMKYEIYLKNEVIIYVKWSGLSPYINKGIVTENSKCCKVFETKTYFKSPTEAIGFNKSLDLKKYDEYEVSKIRLAEISFEEQQVVSARSYYNAISTIEEFSQKIN